MDKNDVEETMTMINDCQDREKKMNEWEREFMDSIRSQLVSTGNLSEKQLAILNRVWEKVT